LIERLARDIFHREVRDAVHGRPGVEQAGNVWVREGGQNILLAGESAAQSFSIELAPQHLDSDRLLKLPIGPPRQINRAHAAVAEFRKDLVSTNALFDKSTAFGCSEYVAGEFTRWKRHEIPRVRLQR